MAAAKQQPEVQPTLSVLDTAKVIGAAVYALMFTATPEAAADILGIFAQIREMGETARKSGNKAFDDATAEFRKAYEEACKPFEHLRNDTSALATYYKSLAETVRLNREDMGDIPPFTNLGRPPKS